MKIFKTETNVHSFQIIGSLDKMAFVHKPQPER